MTVALDLSSKSFRSVAATATIFLALAAVWVVSDGWIGSDSNAWLRAAAAAGTGSGLGGGATATTQSSDFQLQLRAALAESEARIANHTAALVAAAVAAGADFPPRDQDDAAASTTGSIVLGDVNRLLEQATWGSPEAIRLSKLRYCNGYPYRAWDDPSPSPPPPPEFYTTPWAPPGDKFLFPLCYSGQISNRLVCMHAHLLLAVLLNRTLVVPERETGALGYAYSIAVDVPHARRCLGGDDANLTIVTLAEYRALTPGLARRAPTVVDRLVCWKPNCPDTPLRHQIWSDTDSSGTPTVTFPPAEPALGPSIRTLADLRAAYAAIPDRLIAVGDLFGAGPSSLPDLPPGLRRGSHPPAPAFPTLSCRLLLQPHPAVVQVAKAFARTVLGPDYLAVHLRRGDFLGFWNRDECRAQGPLNRGCRAKPLPLLARCIAEKAAGTNVSVVFAATNAAPVELALLRDLLAAARPPLALVTVPDAAAGGDGGGGGGGGVGRFRWAAPWRRLKLDDHPLALATLDKLVCAMARVFMGTRGSTFTADIAAMRAALGTLSCRDQDVCAGFQYGTDRLPFFNETDPESKLTFRKRRRRRRLLL